jgi:hypothetical protein
VLRPSPFDALPAAAADERELPLAEVKARDAPALDRAAIASPPPSRPPAGTAPTWFCAILCLKLAVSCENDCREALLCAVPKKCSDPLRTVDGAAARPLADRLARDGTTGRFPAIMRAPPNCACVAAAAVTRPAPKCPAFTVDRAPPT